MYRKEEHNFFFSFLGNLYTRQVQIEGKTLAIQVQDTPGIQVRSSEICDLVRGGLLGCGLVHLSSGYLTPKEERNLGSQVSAFICLSFQLYLAHGQSEPGSVWETWLRGRNLLLGGFSPARETKPNTLGLGTTRSNPWV